MSLIKKVFNFGKQFEPGPAFIPVDFPAPDDAEGINWVDPNRQSQLKAIFDENWTELVALIDFVKGHMVKDHGLSESVHLEYQKKCKEVLLNKGFITDVRKFKCFEEIITTIENMDFDNYPQTEKNLWALMDYICAPKSKGLFLCQKGVWLRERPNIEGAVVSILREKDNPNYVFDINNSYIKAWEANFPRLYNHFQEWRAKLKVAAEKEKNFSQGK